MQLTLTDLKTAINRKIPISIKVFTILIFLLVVSLLIVITTYKYYTYTDYLGYIGKDGEYYVALYLEDSSINNFKNDALKIEEEEFDLKEMIISDEYYILNNKSVRLVKLYGNINEKYLIINNVINLKARGEITTIFKEIKKGLNL